MKHYLRLSSLFLLFIASCATPYKGLQQQQVPLSVYRFQPEFDKVLYRCIVDGRFIFKKFHLSGVLFFKQLENGTKRAIFQNEMGIAFFDLEWDKDGNFKVRQIMEQLDKEAVKKTLRKDLEMLLMMGMDKNSEIMLGQDRGKEQLYRLNREGGYVYYTIAGNDLVKIENADNRKKIITVNVGGKATPQSMPDSVLFDHHKANFTISLTKIERNVNE
jgi:hypothetical protein